MTKPPRVRHSKTQREPVTIELDPSSVSRVDEPAAAVGEEAIAEASETPAAADREQPAADLGADGHPGNETPQAGSDEPANPDPGASTFGRKADSRTGMPPLAPAPAPRRGAGLVSGLAGGAIALLAAGGLNYAGLLPLSIQNEDAGGSEAAIVALRSEIETLKADLASLRAAPGGAGMEELRQALADQTGRVDGLASSLDTVIGDLATLRQAVDAGGGEGASAIQALETRVRAMESLIAGLSGGGGTVSEAQIAELAAKIATVESAASAASAAAATAESGTAEVAAKLASIEQAVTDLASRIEGQSEQPKVALAIAAAALRAALDRGGTFTAEVETFAVIAANSPDLPALREAAAAGVSTRAELVAGMPKAAEAMIDAGRAAEPEAGFWASLWESLKSLVSVRPIGAMEGPGVPETVSRIEAAVQQGDLGRALSEYDALPEPVKAAAFDFAQRLRTRHTVEQLVEKALADALKAA
ncbi:MAG: COG4223 family protein [Rhizobiaceae bacterium]